MSSGCVVLASTGVDPSARWTFEASEASADTDPSGSSPENDDSAQAHKRPPASRTRGNVRITLNLRTRPYRIAPPRPLPVSDEELTDSDNGGIPGRSRARRLTG